MTDLKDIGRVTFKLVYQRVRIVQIWITRFCVRWFRFWRYLSISSFFVSTLHSYVATVVYGKVPGKRQTSSRHFDREVRWLQGWLNCFIDLQKQRRQRKAMGWWSPWLKWLNFPSDQLYPFHPKTVGHILLGSSMCGRSTCWWRIVSVKGLGPLLCKLKYKVD